MQQLPVDGFFHADPHPGNVALTDDGRIALIDLGMVARVSPRFQENLIQLLLSISEGRGDETADMTIKMGEPKLNFDEKSFRRSVSDLVLQSQNAQLENIDAGRVVLRITQISGDCNFRLPPDFTMIANRITIGLLLAALIVGAALMMRVETSFKILGYPGIAIIFFLLAAIGALVLVFNILFRDERHKGESSDSQ